jgi:hypothetical protein|tara:strand:+ start:520 stop:960 length:441 start_codon:yes stop_codon:yes gene_type:complete
MSANVKQPIFANFLEYWYFAKTLSDSQREIIFASLPYDQRSKLERSYERGGWHDVVVRNELNAYVDFMEEEIGYNLLDIRCKIMKGKSVYMPKDCWEQVLHDLDEYKSSDTEFILGGIHHEVCDVNPNVVLLTKNGPLRGKRHISK